MSFKLATLVALFAIKVQASLFQVEYVSQKQTTETEDPVYVSEDFYGLFEFLSNDCNGPALLEC